MKGKSGYANKFSNKIQIIMYHTLVNIKTYMGKKYFRLSSNKVLLKKLLKNC